MSNRLTIKGQVTVPKHVREFLGLRAGSSAVRFSIEPDGSVRITKAEETPSRLDAIPNPRPYADCDRILSLLAGRAY